MSSLIEQLAKSFKCLPGVGMKSAQRMVFHILERDRSSGQQLAKTLLDAIERIGNCRQCRNLSEHELCSICSHPARDPALLCVVETPADVMAIEQTVSYRGYYFVLMGHLSPIDGIGPEEIGIELFKDRLAQAELKEVILATNPTVEGEATAFYLSELVKKSRLKATRIAHGVPLGGELEYLDSGTLIRAMNARLDV